MSLRTGVVFQDKYEIIDTAGVGGMGSVFKAQQKLLGKPHNEQTLEQSAEQ